MSVFCDQCGSLLPPNRACPNTNCSEHKFLQVVPEVRTVPSEINAHATKGMLGHYRYSTSDDSGRRKKRLFQLYVDLLIHSGANQVYVESFGPPRSDQRVSRIEIIMSGLNEFSWGSPDIRNQDINWLKMRHSSNLRDNL